jgi:hypothetical protein
MWLREVVGEILDDYTETTSSTTASTDTPSTRRDHRCGWAPSLGGRPQKSSASGRESAHLLAATPPSLTDPAIPIILFRP